MSERTGKATEEEIKGATWDAMRIRAFRSLVKSDPNNPINLGIKGIIAELHERLVRVQRSGVIAQKVVKGNFGDSTRG